MPLVLQRAKNVGRTEAGQGAARCEVSRRVHRASRRREPLVGRAECRRQDDLEDLVPAVKMLQRLHIGVGDGKGVRADLLDQTLQLSRWFSVGNGAPHVGRQAPWAVEERRRRSRPEAGEPIAHDRHCSGDDLVPRVGAGVRQPVTDSLHSTIGP
jgi:hypothetical protein